MVKKSFQKKDLADKPKLSKLFNSLNSVTGVKAPQSEPEGTDALTVGGLISQLEAVNCLISQLEAVEAVCSVVGLGKVTSELPLINYHIINT